MHWAAAHGRRDLVDFLLRPRHVFLHVVWPRFRHTNAAASKSKTDMYIFHTINDASRYTYLFALEIGTASFHMYWNIMKHPYQHYSWEPQAGRRRSPFTRARPWRLVLSARRNASEVFITRSDTAKRWKLYVHKGGKCHDPSSYHGWSYLSG